MAKDQQNYRDVLSRLEAKDKKGTSIEDAYDVLSFLPGTGEAIAAYELPEVLSQSGKMISSDDFVEAAAGTGLATLGVASVLPGVGPVARYVKKGIEGFIPYLGPKTATAGGPDIDSSVMKMEGDTSGVSAVPDDLNLGSGSLFAPESKKNRRLLVLSCSDTKCPDVGDKEAIDRYLGPVFQSLKSMGIPSDVDVAIMSAKHGLIRADTPIENYNDKMSPKKAELFKQDASQMNRIKNTLEGYDNVIVQGGKDYKDVIQAAVGDAKITEVPGGRGIGDQRKDMKEAVAFGKIDTPVYHFSRNTDPGFTKFDPDKAPAALDGLGIHVGSTPKAAEDRFMDLTFGFDGRLNARNLAKEKGIDYDTAIGQMGLPNVEGNVGYQKIGSGQFSLPIPRKTLGGSIPLKADLSNPYIPEGNFKRSQDPKQWQESELTDHFLDKYNEDRGTTFTMQDLVGDKPNFPFGDFRKFIGEFRKDLSKEGFTHLPYYNDVEDVASTSYIMLTDRPKGSTKVLQSPFAKKDPKKFDDPDIMKEDGGVVSLKEKAVNMNRGPRGIEPYIQYMENGGEPKYEQGQDLGDVEMRADLEPYLYGNPLARLGYELYKEGKIDIQGVVSESGGGSQRSYGLFSKDRGEIGYIADQREDSPDPLRILTHELAHAAMDFIEGKDQAGREGFNKYGNVDYEESMVRGGDVLIDRRSPSGEKLAQNYFGRLNPTTKDMKKFMNVSKVAQEALDKKGLPPEAIAEGDTGFYGTSGNRLLSNTDKLRRFFLMDPQRNVNNYLNLTGEDIRKAEGGVIGLKDRAVKMHRNVV